MKYFEELPDIHPDSTIDLPPVLDWQNNKNRLKSNLPLTNQTPSKIVWMIFDVIECWITHLPAVENCQKNHEKKSMFNVVFSNKKSLKGNSHKNLLNLITKMCLFCCFQVHLVYWRKWKILLRSYLLPYLPRDVLWNRNPIGKESLVRKFWVVIFLITLKCICLLKIGTYVRT